jgi:hypothetical protein
MTYFDISCGKKSTFLHTVKLPSSGPEKTKYCDNSPEFEIGARCFNI